MINKAQVVTDRKCDIPSTESYGIVSIMSAQENTRS